MDLVVCLIILFDINICREGGIQIKYKNKLIIFLFLDFMAMLSDPGGFSKASEQQAQNMKAMGIEQEEKPKKKEPEGPKWGLKILI